MAVETQIIMIHTNPPGHMHLNLITQRHNLNILTKWSAGIRDIHLSKNEPHSDVVEFSLTAIGLSIFCYVCYLGIHIVVYYSYDWTSIGNENEYRMTIMAEN